MTMKYSTTLKQRVEALLKPNQDRGTIGSFGRFGFSLFALAALLVMAPIPKPETATVSADMLKIPASSAGFGIGASAVATIEPMLVQLSVVAEDDTTGLARKLRELRRQLEQMKQDLKEQEATLNAFTSEIDRMRVEGFTQEDELRLKERIAQAERDVARATEQMGHQFSQMDLDFPDPPHLNPEIHEQALAQMRESMAQMKMQFESQEWKEQLEQNLRAAQEEMQQQLQSMHEGIPTEEMKREMEQLHRQLIEEEMINREELQEAIRESQLQFREQTKQQMEQARQQLEEMRGSMPSEEELLSKISEAMEEAKQSMPTKEIIKAEMGRLQEHLQMMAEKLQQLERENNNQQEN